MHYRNARQVLLYTRNEGIVGMFVETKRRVMVVFAMMRVAMMRVMRGAGATATSTARMAVLRRHNETRVITALLHIPLDLLFWGCQNETIHIVTLFLFRRGWSDLRSLFRLRWLFIRSHVQHV